MGEGGGVKNTLSVSMSRQKRSNFSSTRSIKVLQNKNEDCQSKFLEEHFFFTLRFSSEEKIVSKHQKSLQFSQKRNKNKALYKLADIL